MSVKKLIDIFDKKETVNIGGISFKIENIDMEVEQIPEPYDGGDPIKKYRAGRKIITLNLVSCAT